MRANLEYAIRKSAKQLKSGFGGDYTVLRACGVFVALIVEIRAIYLAFKYGVIISLANTCADALIAVVFLGLIIFAVAVGTFTNGW